VEQLKASLISNKFLQKANNKYRLFGASAGIYEIDDKGQVCDDGAMLPIARLIEKVLAILLNETENTNN